MSKLKIYIADDHTFVRKGMIRLLNTFERVGDVKEAANGKELISLVQGEVPNIVILDLEMPVMNGFDCAKHLVDNHPDVKILILTMHTEEVFFRKHQQTPHYLAWREKVASMMATPRIGEKYANLFPDPWT